MIFHVTFVATGGNGVGKSAMTTCGGVGDGVGADVTDGTCEDVRGDVASPA